MKYQIFLKSTNSDSTFFHGEAEHLDYAIAKANEAYFEKWPEKIGTDIEWGFILFD